MNNVYIYSTLTTKKLIELSLLLLLPLIQGVSRLYVITAGGDFLGLREEESSLNMCPILDGYGVMTVF
jgi:hypothetical protein